MAHKIKKFILNIKILRNLIYRFRYFKMRYLKTGKPLLVLSIGKTGTSTVYNALRKGLPKRAVMHLHRINPNSIREAEDFLRKHNELPQDRHVYGRQLAKEISERSSSQESGFSKSKDRWEIISLVRDPLYCNISAYFQSIQRWYPNIAADYKSGAITIDDLTQNYLSKFPHDWPSNWFGREIFEVFGLDIYETPFDKSLGYKVYENDLIRLLLIRLEDLDNTGVVAIGDFTGLDKLVLCRSNDTRTKSYNAAYSDFLKRAVLPDSYIVDVYEDDFSKYFYTQPEIDTFKKRWISDSR